MTVSAWRGPLSGAGRVPVNLQAGCTDRLLWSGAEKGGGGGLQPSGSTQPKDLDHDHRGDLAES